MRKILAPTSSVQQLLQRQLSSLSDREKNVKIGWTRRRKCLEERQTYDLFEKICRAALTQIQDLLQKTPNEAKQNLGTRFRYILWFEKSCLKRDLFCVIIRVGGYDFCI